MTGELRRLSPWRAGIALSAALLVPTVWLGWSTSAQLEQVVANRERERLRSVAEALAALAARGEFNAPQLAQLARFTGTELALIDARGHVFASAPSPPELYDSQAGQPELSLARATGGEAMVVRTDSLNEQPVQVVVRPLWSQEGGLHGYARVLAPTAPLDTLHRLLRELRVAALAVVALGAVLIASVAKERLSKPLREMARVAEAMAEGGEPATPYTTRSDEIGVFARSLGEMARRLRERLEAIDAERTQLLAVLGGMVEGVIAVDHEDRVLHINKVAAQLLGVTAGASFGKPIWEVTRIPAIVEALDHPTSSAPAREAVIATSDQEHRVWIYSAPLRNAMRRSVGAVVVLHDVTELRRLENLRREFVANVSHELKTPVSAIIGIVDTLLDDRAMPAATRERFLGRIREQADRLLKLIIDLLALSRLESVDFERALPREKIDLRDPVRASLEHQRPLALAKGLALSVSLPSNSLWVWGDGESLRQLTDNLLSNAIGYTPAGGSVSLSLAPDGDHAVLVVEDTGIGIDPVHHARVFERFYRTDKARSRALGGTGLGLAIVKHVALAHGGNVALDSAPDQGSTFRVQIPLDQAAERR